jgi:hypothetical protein
LPKIRNNAILVKAILLGVHMQGKDQQSVNEGDGSGNFWLDYLTVIISKGVPEAKA